MDGTGTPAGAGGPTAARPAQWRFNFLVLGADVAFFTLALNISSAQTILPLYVHRLMPSNEAVAAITAVRAFGAYAPQLLIAPLTERLRLTKPLVLAVTVFERVPFLALALATLWLAHAAVSALLAIFFVMLLIQTAAGGLVFPAWLDLIARTIPLDWRGRFLGWWQGVGGLLGIGGAALATALVASLPWPGDFIAIFGATFAVMIVSFVLLSLGREVPRSTGSQEPRAPRATPPARSLPALATTARGQLHANLRLLGADGGLRWLLAANGAAGIATMAGALFAVSALSPGGLTADQVSAQSIVLALAMTLGNFSWGTIGDRLGHRAVLIGAAVCAGISAALALGARGMLAYGVVFFLLGGSISATLVGQWTFITELAPAARRPTYIAVAAVGYAPFAVGAPILGGWLADHWGYGLVFGLSIAAAALACALYLLRVPEPRHAAPPAPTGRARSG